MTWEQPTYEDYLKATPFARIRYKWGLVVVGLAWISIMALMVYTVIYVEELTTNPLKFAAEEFGLSCYCNNFETGQSYIFNSTEVKVQESPIYYKFQSYYNIGSK